MAVINGKQRDDANGATVLEFLRANGYNTRYIAVELNEEILSRDKFEGTVLKAEDTMEIVNFVGGGC